MKDIIKEKLDRISDLKDRRALRNVLTDVFENVIDYNMEMYKRLEERIYNEIEDPMDRFHIYCGISRVSEVDPISDFLHPMLEADLKSTDFDMKEINEKLNLKEELFLTSVYMKCDSITLNEILAQNRNYKGFVKTDKNIHEVTLSIKRTKKYTEVIENLYRVFQINAVEWKTVNCAHAYKFIDIFLVSELEISEDENITEITIDLAEYEKYKVPNLIPLWNVERITLDDKSFPMPAKDRINYDHLISLTEIGIDNGYLAAEGNSDFIYTKRYENDFIIISPIDDQHSWNIVVIKSPSNFKGHWEQLQILSNKKELGFIGRYNSIKSLRLRTKAEIDREISAYEISKEFDFYDVEVYEEYIAKYETDNLNSFIDDNIRVDKFKKTMVVKFVPENREDYLVYDKLSFLVSELQLLFPEYKCIGALV